MEKIFDYIVFNIIMLQKIRGITNSISKDNLEEIIDTVISRLSTKKEVKSKLIEEFYFDYEFERFLNDYFDYFYFDNEILYLEDNVFLEKAEFFLGKLNLDSNLEKGISELLENNLRLKQLYGIVIRKDIYDYIHGLYERIGNLYNGSIDKKKLDLQKKLLLESNILSFNIENSMDVFEVYDLQLYVEETISKRKRKRLEFNIENNEFFYEDVENDPFFLSLLGEKNTEDEIIKYKNDMLFTRYIEPLRLEKLEDYSFYLMYYYLLLEEIEKTRDINVKNKLILAKNNLMKTLDIVFSNTLFMGKDNSDSLLHDFNSTYCKMSDISFFFVDEVATYGDSDYLDDNVKYQNILKKIYIKAYYELTHDKYIEYAIEERSLCSDNSISSNMLSKILSSGDEKKRKK